MSQKIQDECVTGLTADRAGCFADGRQAGAGPSTRLFYLCFHIDLRIWHLLKV